MTDAAADRVGRRFGAVQALHDVSLDIDAGDFVALLGPSGCGKSTLLRLIAGLDQPDSGRLAWEPDTRRNRETSASCFRTPRCSPGRAQRTTCSCRCASRGTPRDQVMPQVHAALHRVGLNGFEAARPRQLSGGMRMRVSIARALVTRPRLLLMDEPFAALDEFTRHKLQEDLLSLWQDLRCTVVFVTHSIYEAAFLARRIVLMTPRPGRIDHEIASPLQPGPEARLGAGLRRPGSAGDARCAACVGGVKYAPALFGLLTLLVWEAAVRISGVPSYLVPGPVAIIAAFLADPAGLLFSLASTLLVTFAALLVAAALGVVLAVGDCIEPIACGRDPALGCGAASDTHRRDRAIDHRLGRRPVRFACGVRHHRRVLSGVRQYGGRAGIGAG